MAQSLAALATLAFIAVAVAVGARLLWLGRSTRGLPERVLGASLLVIVGIGYPLTLAGQVGLTGDAPVAARWFLALGGIAMAAGWSGVWVFTWKVFRSHSGLVRGLTFAGIAATLASALVSGWGVVRATDVALIDFGGPGYLALPMLAMLCNAWAAGESFVYYRKMRKRVAIGLTDALVANRFLLWTLVMLLSMLSTGTQTGAILQGIDVIESPPVLIASALAGIACSSTLWLAFLPPRFYVRMLETA